MQTVSNDPESVAIDNLRTQIAHEESVSLIQAVFTATDEAKSRALAILQGEEDPTALSFGLVVKFDQGLMN